MIERLVLFGASGDLAARFLLPALAALEAAGDLPPGFRLTGLAAEAWDDDSFREHARRALAEHAAEIPMEARDAITGAARYRRVDFDDATTVRDALAGDHEPLVAYLALPPSLFPAAVRALGEAGLPHGSRIAVEKPFGEDLASAIGLNRLLAGVTGRREGTAVYRVDHFLGFSIAGRLRETDWDSARVERVEIVWEETRALDGRGYYDTSGALKDVLQNHLLQILCLLATPPCEDAGDLLRAVRPPRVERTRRARYSGYADEDGVDPGRRTETFAEVVLEVANERWAGTPFTLRTGKAFGRARGEVVALFRDGSEERIGLLDAADGAYERVLRDLLGAGTELSVGADAAEEAWRIFMPVLEAWRDEVVPLEEYAPGADGPTG